MAPSKQPNENGIVKRRNRIPLSCESCRLRKLKCDRQKPCQNCKARDMQGQCVYAADDTSRANRGSQPISNPEDMGDRLQRLESIISSMVKAPAAPASNGEASMLQAALTRSDAMNGYPAVESALQPATPYGAMVSAAEGHHFIGESHWEAVLRDITSIRESLEESKSQARPLPLGDQDSPPLLGGVTKMVSKAEMLSSLPNKNLADRLLLRFWDAWNPSTPRIIHKPTFNKHFDEWWSNLEGLTFPRLGILFTIFSMALHTYELAGDEPPDLRGYVSDLGNNYAQRGAQCVWASDITVPNQDSLTCLLLHWVGEFYRRSSASIGLWMMHSFVVRKAMLMGYHRDPSSFPSIKPLDAELRRRAWHAICQGDLLLSFHLGLPSMIDYAETDVAAPRSLHEEELYEQMESLPPERPITEPTPISYTIAKRNMFQVFGKVVRYVNSIKVPTDEQLDQLNKEMAEVNMNTFPHLRKKAWEESLADSPEVRLQRISLQAFYNKALCVLNRRYILSRGTTEFALSCRALCIENALELLETQDTMQTAGYRWEKFLYTRNDFLLATVIICLALYTSKKPESQVQGPWDPTPLNEESKLRQTLDRARQIWISYANELSDARRACQIIDAILHKLQTGNQSLASSSIDSSIFSSQSAASLTPVTPESIQDFTDLDWSSWDSIIQGTNLETSVLPTDNLWQLEAMKM